MTKLEEMARAVAEAYETFGQTGALRTSPMPEGMAEALIRAALAVMREPDEGMAEAAYQAVEDGDRWVIEDDKHFGRAFTAAINHLLNEEQK